MGQHDTTRLLKRIGQLGDRLMIPDKLSQGDDEASYIAMHDPPPPYWSLCYRLSSAIKRRKVLRVFKGLLPIWALLDGLQLVLRLVMFPFVWAAWRGERWRSRRKGRSWFCPVCHNPMQDPLVYCTLPSCRRVQGALRPRVTALFSRRCAGKRCGHSRWTILGQYARHQPASLACRNTSRTSGCYQPHPLKDLSGREDVRHICLAGTTCRAKHAVLAYLLEHAVKTGLPKEGPCQIHWKLSQLEYELARRKLYQSQSIDTGECETPGDVYTLGRSIVLQRPSHRALAVHNMAKSWLEDETVLYQNGYCLASARSLLFVIDQECLQDPEKDLLLPHMAALSRLIRVVQQRLFLLPNQRIPLKVAIVLPLSKSSGLAVPKIPGAAPRDAIESLLKEKCPGPISLLKFCVAPSNLNFFAGPIPEKFDARKTAWLKPLLEWCI